MKIFCRCKGRVFYFCKKYSMKIFSIEQIREADRYTIQNEPIASIDLMERAASMVFQWLENRVRKEETLCVFCGMGNNGGDGLALARMLAERDIIPHVYMVWYSDKMSPDCQANYTRLQREAKVPIHDIRGQEDFPECTGSEVFVDALFGSGLNRPLQGLAAALIDFLNRQKAVKLSIDIASGLFADAPSPRGAIFQPHHTLTFQTPKLAFMMPENEPFVGQLEILDIQLHPDFLNDAETNLFLVEQPMIEEMVHVRPRFSHKGTYGHALLIAGSEDKTGAALLGAKACMRTGVGLLSVLLPKSSWTAINTFLPEAMLYTIEDVRPGRNTRVFDDFGRLDAFTAIGVGPGLGKADDTVRALKRLIQQCEVPLVLDADALNILAENRTWLSFLPSKAILTPHPKEFERLFGKSSHSFERLELQRSMAMKYQIIIVLKGANTSIALPNGSVFFNSTGNPGMATAGSGDVLTGIILSLLAQRYLPEEAAVMGVYLHGLAGDLGADAYGQHALIATDIIDHIGSAYQYFV